MLVLNKTNVDWGNWGGRLMPIFGGILGCLITSMKTVNRWRFHLIACKPSVPGLLSSAIKDWLSLSRDHIEDKNYRKRMAGACIWHLINIWRMPGRTHCGLKASCYFLLFCCFTGQPGFAAVGSLVSPDETSRWWSRTRASPQPGWKSEQKPVFTCHHHSADLHPPPEPRLP